MKNRSCEQQRLRHIFKIFFVLNEDKRHTKHPLPLSLAFFWTRILSAPLLFFHKRNNIQHCCWYIVMCDNLRHLNLHMVHFVSFGRNDARTVLFSKKGETRNRQNMYYVLSEGSEILDRDFNEVICMVLFIVLVSHFKRFCSLIGTYIFPLKLTNHPSPPTSNVFDINKPPGCLSSWFTVNLLPNMSPVGVAHLYSDGVYYHFENDHITDIIIKWRDSWRINVN